LSAKGGTRPVTDAGKQKVASATLEWKNRKDCDVEGYQQYSN
jgi:hypothetical protein